MALPGRYCCKRALKAGDQHDSVFLARFATGADMMGRRNQSQGQLFYELRLDDAVPDDHLVRKISALLDLSWVYAELASPITLRLDDLRSIRC